MSNQTKSKRPSHSVYIVDGEGDKANWIEVGAMWAHDDGQGFNLNLKALPMEGRLVIRQRKAKGEQAGEGVAR